MRPLSYAKRTHKDSTGSLWNYVNEDELQAIYPNGGFKVFSDMHMRGNSKAQNYLSGQTTEIVVYPYKRKQSWAKRTVGYIPVTDANEEEGFIRIIGNAWQRVLFLILAILVCAAIFLVGVWFAQRDEVPGLDKTAVSYHIDGVKNTDEDSILLPGLSVLNGKANDTHIKAVLMNPDGNGCYFKYTIIQKDSEEVLYTSGLIEPGKAVTEFDLNKKLKAGKYPIQVIVETNDLKNPEIVYNAGNIDAQLVVTEE